MLSHLEEYQTNLGYYTYNSTGIGLYNIDGKSSLVYVSPREIKSNETRTYSNKTYEYTHGYGAIITSASTTNENRNIKVFKSSFNDDNQAVKITEPRIYFGLANK